MSREPPPCPPGLPPHLRPCPVHTLATYGSHHATLVELVCTLPTASLRLRLSLFPWLFTTAQGALILIANPAFTATCGPPPSARLPSAGHATLG